MSVFSCAFLIRKRHFRFLSGVEPSVFMELVERLRPHWNRRVESVKKRRGRPRGVGDLEDHLLVLLILYRCGLTQEFLGCLYRTDRSTICRSLRRIETLAVRFLGAKRSIRVSCEEAKALIVDCTEQPVQRPKRKQRCWYSGKKKRHTIKTEIIITENGRIVSISKAAPGKVHDLTMRRRGPPLPEKAHVYADSGYQGLQEEHAATDIPYKKTKNRKLTRKERKHNRELSSFRVRVEHSIGKMKTFRILSERYRYPRKRYDIKSRTVAGIINIAAGF